MIDKETIYFKSTDNKVYNGLISEKEWFKNIKKIDSGCEGLKWTVK